MIYRRLYDEIKRSPEQFAECPISQIRDICAGACFCPSGQSRSCLVQCQHPFDRCAHLSISHLPPLSAVVESYPRLGHDNHVAFSSTLHPENPFFIDNPSRKDRIHLVVLKAVSAINTAPARFKVETAPLRLLEYGRLVIAKETQR